MMTKIKKSHCQAYCRMALKGGMPAAGSYQQVVCDTVGILFRHCWSWLSSHKTRPAGRSLFCRSLSVWSFFGFRALVGPAFPGYGLL